MVPVKGYWKVQLVSLVLLVVMFSVLVLGS